VPVCYAIQGGALRTNPLSGPDGIGVQAQLAYTLEARAEVQCVALQDITGRDKAAVAYNINFCDTGGSRPDRRAGGLYVTETDMCGALTCAEPTVKIVHPASQVRRLTPEECEILQGFPRGHTAIPWRKKPADQCPDGPRYKALGNSMAVPVMSWIGKQIDFASLF
jgi:DNA (cytosine-5)-methyltransferase 1